MSTALIGALLFVSGCSSGIDGDGADGSVAFNELVGRAIDAAEAGGASDDQLAILRDAQVEGALSFEETRSAILATMDCVEASGGEVMYTEDSRTPGLVVPGFVVLAKDDATLTSLEPLIDECGLSESFWVNMVYQLQPGSQASRGAFLEKQAPVIRQCLEDNGYATDPLATPEELVHQAMEVSSETNNAVSCYD